MIEWIQANYVACFAVVGAVYAAARTIVLLTPTPKDNAALDKVGIILRTLAKAFGLTLQQGVTTGKLKKAPITPIVLLLILSTFLISCRSEVQQNPRAELLVAQKTFIVVVDILVEMQALNKFKQETTNRLTVLIHEGQEYLARWMLAIEAGEDQPCLGDSVNNVIRQLVLIQLTKGGN